MIESLVTSRNWVPHDAQPVHDPSELPSILQKHARKAEQDQRSWRAWPTYDGFRLFVGEMSMESCREFGRPVIQLHYYNGDGRLQEYSVWIEVTSDTWRASPT